MAKTAKKTDPNLWERVKDRVTKGDKGGKPGQWSARKAQMASTEYQKEGGGYEGGPSRDNGLKRWTEEEWGTKSGHESGKTGERYLPKKARAALTDAEYARSSRKKRADGAEGRQHSRQPRDVARKAASARRSGKDGASKGGTGKGGARKGGPTKAELMGEAKARGIRGRSRMTKDALARALA